MSTPNSTRDLSQSPRDYTWGNSEAVNPNYYGEETRNFSPLDGYCNDDVVHEPDGSNSSTSLEEGLYLGSGSFDASHMTSYPTGPERLPDQLFYGANRSLLSPGTVASRAYLWDVQNDPELEAKRKRAVKAFKNRVKKEQELSDLETKLRNLQEEVKILKAEKAERENVVSQLEYHHDSALPNQNDDTPGPR